MKKNFMWTMAALFVSGLAFTACQVVDNPNPYPEQGNVEDFWDKTSTSYDFEDEDVSMFKILEAARLSVTAVDDATLGSKVAKFNCGNANKIAFASYDFSSLVKKATQVKISFDFNVGNTSGMNYISIADATVHTAATAGFTGKNSWGYGANGSIFYLGSNRGNLGSGNENFFVVNGEPKAASLDTLVYKANDIFGQWLHAVIKVNAIDKKVSYEITKDEEVLYSAEGLPFVNEQANECTQIDVYLGNKGTTMIDNLTIENAVDPSIKYADAKIVFVDPDGNELKDSRTVNGRVGSNVILVASDKTPIYNSEKTVKWVYDTDNAAETPIAEEGTVVTVKFKDSGKYAWRLRQYFNDGEGNGTRIGTEWIEGEQFVGDNYQVFYQCAYKHPTDGKWYVAPITNNSYQNRSYTFTGNESTNAAGTIHLMDVKYEKVDSIVWMGEFEDKTAMTLVGEVETWIGWTDPALWEPGNGNANLHFERFSNGQAARLKDGSYFVINDAFEEGDYKIFIYGRSGGSEAQAPTLYYVPAGAAIGELVKIEAVLPTIPTTTGGITIENVKLPAGAKLVIKNDGTTGVDLDLISICKQPKAE